MKYQYHWLHHDLKKKLINQEKKKEKNTPFVHLSKTWGLVAILVFYMSGLDSNHGKSLNLKGRGKGSKVMKTKKTIYIKPIY